MGIKRFWYLILAAIVLASFGLRFFMASAWGKFQVDRLVLRTPVFGTLVRKGAISRFARTFAMLVASGVPILQSLEIVREVIGNEVLARVIGNVHMAVEKGEKMSEPLRVSGEFPLDTVHMVSVGEETGNLDEMLSKISDFYDRFLDYTVKKLTTVVEPLLLAVMGGMVGLIMSSMLLPMFDMMKILKH